MVGPDPMLEDKTPDVWSDPSDRPLSSQTRRHEPVDRVGPARPLYTETLVREVSVGCRSGTRPRPEVNEVDLRFLGLSFIKCEPSGMLKIWLMNGDGDISLIT